MKQIHLWAFPAHLLLGPGDFTGILTLVAVFFQATEHNFAKFSLFFIRSDYPIRSGLIWLIRSKYFDRTILVAIILNCIALMLDSKRPNFEETGLGKGLMPFEYLFLGIFTAEMIIKIVAMGFMLSPHTYMRDGEWLTSSRATKLVLYFLIL